MVALNADAEGGTQGATVATGGSGSGNAWDAVVGTPTITYDNTHAYGVRSYKVIGAGSAQQMVWTSASLGTVGELWGRFYIYSSGAPSAATGVARFTVGGSQAARIRYNADGTLTLADSGNAAEVTTAAAIPTGQWVRVEFRIQFVATNATVHLKTWNSPDSSGTPTEDVSVTNAAGMGVNCDRVEWGSFNSATVTFWLDNLNVNTTAFPGPVAGNADKTASDSATLTQTAALAAATTGADSAALTESALITILGVPIFRFAVDWDGDGDFTGPGEDVTERVLARGSFSATFGRDQARALSPPASGRAAFTLNNTSRDYSPDNAGSPLAGDLLPARGVQSTVDLNGTRHTLFRGQMDDYQVKVAHNDYSVDVTALDVLAQLKGAKISTPLHQGIRTGDAIGYILDAVGWPAELRDLDPGATVIRWWWLNQEDAFDSIVKLIGSEGPGAIVHADAGGGIVFRDRLHRLLRTASTTSQATITDGADGYEPAFSAITYDHGWRDIINSVQLTVDELDPSDDFEEVWSSPNIYNIGASATITIDVQTNDPIKPGSIFLTYAFSGTVTASFTQNSAQSITLSFTAGVSGALLSELIVHGQPVTKRRSYNITQTDPASITKYGLRSPTTAVEAPWAGVHDADAIAQLIIGARAERLPLISVEFRGIHSETRLLQQLGRDLSDRVHVTETQTGLDTDFFLEQISHTVAGGAALTTTFGMEKAAMQVADVFRFDDADHGFDDGVFGSPGLDDPELLFIFDQAGHGFDDGVFAT